jgi:TPR repeat protein
MASFGRYEVVDELYRTPFGYVCSARLAGTEGNGNGNGRLTDYLVKVYDPAGAEASPDERGASDFLSRARLQQKMGAAQAPHWARVHDLGISEAKPYYVTDYYPRTAQKLVVGRVILNSAALHEIISSVAQGLRELREACHQPHGGLKPSNVLIGGAGEVSGAKIVLTDPLCGVPEGESDHGGDCYALGMLLYQLVAHRQFRPTAWPVEDSEEWSRLGKSAVGWRSLCTALLNPDVTQRPDPEGLQRSLDQLAPRGFGVRKLAGVPGRAARRVPVKKLSIAAALLAIGTAGTGIVVYANETATRQSIRQARALWLDALRNDKKILARLSGAGRPIADQSDLDLLYGFDRPVALADFTPAAFRRAQAAQAALAQIHARLLSAYSQSSETLKTLQTACARDGYTQAAGYIGSLATAPTPDDAHLVESIDRRLRFATFLTTAPAPQPNPETVQALAALDASADSGLHAFANVLRTEFRTGAVLSTQGWQPDAQIEELAVQVASVKDWPAGYAAQEFIRREKIDLQHPTLQDVRRFVALVPQYAWVPPTDQRRTAERGLADQLEQADRQIRADLFPHLATDDPEIQKYEQERGAIQAQLAQLSTAQFVQRDFPAAFDARAHDLAAQIASLPTRYHYHPEELSPWFDRMNGIAAKFQSPAIQSYWHTWMNGRTAANADRDWMQRTESLATNLTKLDSATFRIPADLSGDPWGGPTRQLAEGEMGTLLKQIAPGSAGPAPEAVTQAQARFGTWCSAVQKLREEYTELQNTMITAPVMARHDARWSGADAQGFWTSQVESDGGAFAGVMKPDVQRLAAVRRVVHETRRDALVETARSAEKPEILLAAWATLARLKQQAFPGPLTPGAMDQWTSLLVRIAQAAGQLPNPQQTELRDQVKQSAAQMWTSALQLANSPAVLESAVKSQAVIGFEPSGAGLPALQRYNLALFSVLRAKAANDPNTAARAVRDLTDQANALPEADRFAIRPLLEQLNKGGTALAATDAQYYLWPAGTAERALAWQKFQSSVSDRVKLADEDVANFQPRQALAQLNGLQGAEAEAKRAEIQAMIDAGSAERSAGDEAYKDRKFAEAFQHYKRAAQGGDVLSLVHLGGLYRSGQGTLQSRDMAAKYFRLAAAAGSVPAGGELAGTYLSYPVWPEQANEPAAVQWFERAGNAGNVEAMAGRAQVALQQRDYETASTWLKRADIADPKRKDPHLPALMRRLARIYDGQRNPAARTWYEIAAARGDPEAQAWVSAQAAGNRPQPQPQPQPQSPPPPPPPRQHNPGFDKSPL